VIKISHVSRIELEIRSLDALIEACNRLGFRFVKNQNTYKWYGRWIGDSPLPDGIRKQDLGKCDHAIKIPDCNYEIGVVKKGGIYILLWDSWESKLRLAVGNNGGILKQAYTQEAIKQHAKLKGYLVTEKKTEKGIRLHLHK